MAAGCAPSLATMQPAHVAPKGHFEATAAIEIGVPTGTVTRIINTGNNLSQTAINNGDVTPDEERQIFDAGVNFAVSPISAGTHFALNYTVLDRWEVGVRYASAAWRLGSRYQFLRHEDGPFDMTLGLGVARQAVEIPLASTVEKILEIDDFTRYTVDASLQIGTSRGFYRVWAGPKFLYSRFDMGMRLAVPPGAQQPDLATFEGNGVYYGGQGGAAIGWRHVFFAVELTLAEMSGHAKVTSILGPRSGGADPIAHDTDVSGFVVYPAFGLIGEF